MRGYPWSCVEALTLKGEKDEESKIILLLGRVTDLAEEAKVVIGTWGL
jgi:hypothetical protein